MTQKQTAAIIIYGGLAIISLSLSLVFGLVFFIVFTLAVYLIQIQFKNASKIMIKQEKEKIIYVLGVAIGSTIMSIILALIIVIDKKILIYLILALLIFSIIVVLLWHLLDISNKIEIKEEELLTQIGLGVLTATTMTAAYSNNFWILMLYMIFLIQDGIYIDNLK